MDIIQAFGAITQVAKVRGALAPGAGVTDYLSGIRGSTFLAQYASSTQLGQGIGLDSFSAWQATKGIDRAVWTAKSIQNVANPEPLDWLKMPFRVNNMARNVEWSLGDLGNLLPDGRLPYALRDLLASIRK